jgi:hypothetical protein
MSVKQEPLKMNHSTASDKKDAERHVEEPPKLELARSSESLEAFGAALGGAVLGVLATLLILAIINNGTLRFNGAATDSLRASVTRIDENLGAVSHNVDVVAGRLAELQGAGGAIGQLQGSLSTLDASLQALDQEMAQQGVLLQELDVTRRNFDTFTAALAQALNQMGAIEAPAAEAAAPMEATGLGEAAAPVEAASAEAAAPVDTESESAAMPIVVADPALAADTVAVYLFIDSNADGAMAVEEASLVGATVILTSSQGETITGQSTDSGVVFEGLAVGAYTVTVEDALGFTLASDSTATVTVGEESAEGQSVYFPVEAGE